MSINKVVLENPITLAEKLIATLSHTKWEHDLLTGRSSISKEDLEKISSAFVAWYESNEGKTFKEQS